MKRLLLLLIAVTASAQVAFRVDPTSAFTTPGQQPGTSSVPIYAVPGSTISVCTSSSCTAQAVTYTSGTVASACPVNAQITLPGSSFCQSTTGTLGQFGFWALPGTYYYTITFPNGQTFGPYAVSVGGSGGGSNLWSALTPGTNTQGPFFIGSGASLSTTGSGTINANLLNSVAISGLPNGAMGLTSGIPRTAIVTDMTGLFTGCSSGAQYLGFDGACHTAAGAGTVTSVGLSVPSWLAVGGSPVTSTGTLAVTPATGQSSHLVIGTCGAGTTFTPCALVAGDIPTLNQNTTGNAATASALLSTPTLCGAGTFPRGIVANGNATGCAAAGGVSSATAGLSGAVIVSPTTGAVVVDLDTAVVPFKASANVFTGANDFSGASRTAANKTGTTPPGTCSVGDTFFDSDATAGQNLYGCTATNTWTVQGGGGGGGTQTFVVSGLQAGASLWQPPNGTPTYAPIAGNETLNASTEAYAQVPIAQTGTLSKACVRTFGTQDNGGTLVVTLRKGGADQTLVITVAANAAAGTYCDTTHTVTLSGGTGSPDSLNWRATQNGATSAFITGITVQLQ